MEKQKMEDMFKEMRKIFDLFLKENGLNKEIGEGKIIDNKFRGFCVGCRIEINEAAHYEKF